MNIYKDAQVLSGGIPTPEQLCLINRYTKSPLGEDQVYCFSVRLCDDLPDRDHERFDTAALEPLAALFRGKTGIVDHDWSSERQIARIFDTEVVHQPEASFILAHCYMLRSEKNRDLIADIEGGIRKEISVGCSMGRMECSICGALYGSCEHRKGVTYDNSLCLAVLSAPADAYEFSFVAVPAQREAGVLKAKKGGVNLSLEEFVCKSGSPELADALQSLQQEAAYGRRCQKQSLEKALSAALLLDLGCEEALLRKAFSSLNGEELSALENALAQKTALLFPGDAQLPHPAHTPHSLDAAFLI